jgi:hypothetical protein
MGSAGLPGENPIDIEDALAMSDAEFETEP